MTNQTQVSAELSEEQAGAVGEAIRDVVSYLAATGNADPEDWARAARAAYAASPGPAMAALITEMQADMSGKTVMSEEAFRELHGKAERLSALEEGLEAAREALSNYACFTPGAPCMRSPSECRLECGKPAGEALIKIQALLTKEQTRG